jgi:hypothetical protein
MDLYTSSLVLGVVGLGALALSGFGQHGHDGHDGHGGHAGHDGAHLHAGHAHGGDAHGAHGHGGHGDDHGDGRGHESLASGAKSLLWSIASPRFLFSFALGFGAAGDLLRPIAGGLVQLALAIVGGVLLERAVVSPLWNFSMRFASTPAATLESAITDHATAVTSFDGNGQGIVSVEVDGQIVQILATLQPADRQLGVRVRAGQQLRIEDVDSATNRCTVSAL